VLRPRSAGWRSGWRRRGHHLAGRRGVDRLFSETQIDAGALLLLPRDFHGDATATDLEIVASRTGSELPYHRISNFLAATVLREGEAVLAATYWATARWAAATAKVTYTHQRDVCPVRKGASRSV